MALSYNDDFLDNITVEEVNSLPDPDNYLGILRQLANVDNRLAEPDEPGKLYDTDVLDAWYETQFHKEMCSKIAELLSQPGANINTKDLDGMTPLHYLVHADFYRSALQELLRHPEIDVNIQNNDGKTPLHIALYYSNDFSAELLLSHPNIDVNIRNNKGKTPLHAAPTHAYRHVIKLLLTHPNIDLNAQDEIGCTFLHYLSFDTCITHAMELLLAHPKTDVNAQDKYGRTPLHFASSCDRVEQTKMLLAHPRIDTSIKDENGETALTGFLENKHHKQKSFMLKLFLEAGAYTPDELDLIKNGLYSIVWKEYERKFYQVQKALDEGPLVGLPSVISSLIAEALHPNVLFWKAISEA